MQLYEISNQYQEAFNQLQEMELDEQTISDSLSLIQDDFDSKAVNVAGFIKNLEVDIKAMKEAEEAIYARRKAVEDKIYNIKEYLKSNMERCGSTYIHHPQFDIKLKKCPPSIEVLNEEIIPKEYLRKIISAVPDKNRIKEAFAGGIQVLGCLFRNDKTRLEIK